jgi:hypothetical protein
MSEFVYRHFNAEGRLLYVGQAKDPLKRFAQHRKKSNWAASSAAMRTENFGSREAALKAERKAILDEAPLFNRRLGSVGNSTPFNLKIAPELKEAAEQAAKDDQRSLTSLVEKLLTDHCRRKGYLESH